MNVDQISFHSHRRQRRVAARLLRSETLNRLLNASPGPMSTQGLLSALHTDKLSIYDCD